MTRINYQRILRYEMAIASIVALLTVIVLWLRQAIQVCFAGLAIQG